MSEAELREACDRAARALSELSKAALEEKEDGQARFAGDLYYASNRAWQELDRVRRHHGPGT